jgi:hypothetical protein
MIDGDVLALAKQPMRVQRVRVGEKPIVIKSSRFIGLIMTTLVWASVAVAQSAPTDLGDDLPPDLTLPSMEAGGPATASPQSSYNQDAVSDAATQGEQSLDGYYPGPGCDPYNTDLHGLLRQIAPIESTGTWLRRGFWYAEADAVIYNRLWARKDKRFAAEDRNVTRGPVDNNNLGFNPIFLNTNRILILNGALPGEDADVRATLGNFLFRDSHNRDHTVEFTAMGGANWEQRRTMSSVDPNGLFVPFFIAGHNRTFNGAVDPATGLAPAGSGSSSQAIDYASDLSSFEFNYRVRGRLGHDQLVMDPNGCWHRAADAGFEREYLVGLRFLKLDESLDWRAKDIGTPGADGTYLIDTENNLFGFQMGTGTTFQAPRWSIGGTAKGGVFLNSALGLTHLDFTADDTGDADLRLRENQLSFVGEFRLQGRYHILPNVSVRAAYEMMLITSAALAPHQATFTTDTSYLNTTGNPFYHGASFGFETYW